MDTSIPADAGFAPITLTAKKLLDILRNLSERSEVVLRVGDDGKCAVRSGGSKFTLATLPAEIFPLMSLDEIRPMGSCERSNRPWVPQIAPKKHAVAPVMAK